MLRMSGIPARVASGFSPGSLNRDTGEYRVRDLDAHSWVEVYFAGIGWVTFDPTPPAAPADRAGQGPQAAPEDEDQARETRTPRQRLAAGRPGCRHGRGRPRRRVQRRRRAPGRGARRVRRPGSRRRGVPGGTQAAGGARHRRGRPARARAGACPAWAGSCPPARRCCSWSNGCGGRRVPPRRATWASCEPSATGATRARRHRRRTGAPCAVSSPRAAVCWPGCEDSWRCRPADASADPFMSV